MGPIFLPDHLDLDFYDRYYPAEAIPAHIRDHPTHRHTR